MTLEEIEAEENLPIRDKIIAIITRDPVSSGGDRVFAEDLMDEYDRWHAFQIG